MNMLVDGNGNALVSDVVKEAVTLVNYPKRKLEAQGNFLIVRADKPKDKTESGLLIPENSRETEFKGTIVAAGPGENLSNGTFVENKYKPGDRIMFHPSGCMGMKFKLDEDPNGEPELFLVMKTYDVYAMID